MYIQVGVQAFRFHWLGRQSTQAGTGVSSLVAFIIRPSITRFNPTLSRQGARARHFSDEKGVADAERGQGRERRQSNENIATSQMSPTWCFEEAYSKQSPRQKKCPQKKDLSENRWGSTLLNLRKHSKMIGNPPYKYLVLGGGRDKRQSFGGPQLSHCWAEPSINQSARLVPLLNGMSLIPGATRSRDSINYWSVVPVTAVVLATQTLVPSPPVPSRPVPLPLRFSRISHTSLSSSKIAMDIGPGHRLHKNGSIQKRFSDV